MVNYHFHRTAPLLGLSLLALTLATGCATSADLEARDGAGLFPTARMTYAFDPDDGEDVDPIHADRGNRWVAEVEGTVADEDFDGVNFKISELTVGGRIRWHEGESSQVNLLIGGTFADATLDVDGATGAASEFDTSNIGAFLGLDTRYYASDHVTVYGRVQNSWLLSDATSLRAELGTEIQLGGPVSLLLGYRWWRYLFDEDNLFSSDADAELLLRGFVAGVSIDL